MNSLALRFRSDIPYLNDAALQHLLRESVLEPMAAEHPYYKALKEKLKPQVSVSNGIAVVPIEGVLAYKPSIEEMLWYGMEDSASVLDTIRKAAADPEVKGMVLDVNSPGGFLTGGPEIGEAIATIKQTRPVVAWTGGMMASLAYWFGSQASAVVATRSAQVGSIGVFCAFMDWSKYYEQAGVKVEVIKNKEADFKGIGVPGTPLTEAQRGHLQERVQSSFTQFRKTVLATRPDVKDESMKGQCFDGFEAKNAGLVDRVGDLNYAIGVARKLARENG